MFDMSNLSKITGRYVLVYNDKYNAGYMKISELSVLTIFNDDLSYNDYKLNPVLNVNECNFHQNAYCDEKLKIKHVPPEFVHAYNHLP